ncbi:MAG TPA: MarR family transcriptional regulator [Rickettsiales bacterium]|nr:MarR family transcriptional regulator [Rickettsiales bacterium]
MSLRNTAQIANPESTGASTDHFSQSRDDYGRAIIKLLRKTAQCMDTHSRFLTKQYDLTIPQVMCLYEVFEKGATTVAVLAENIHVSSSTLIGVIDRLEEKRFVKRMRDGTDRRSVYINITAKGHQFVVETPYLLHNRLRDSINALDHKKQLMIADALNTINQLLEQREAV